MSECQVPERKIVGIRTEGPHNHITAVKLADGSKEEARDVLAAIEGHEAHYVMDLPGHDLPLLVRGQQCPDCEETVLYA